MFNDEVILTIECPFCGAEHEVVVSESAYYAYIGGELAQVAFPNLTPTEREQIISHLCPECQAKVFGSEEDEEDWDEPDDLESGFDPYEGCYTYDC